MADEELVVSGAAALSEADLAAAMRHLPDLRARWLVPVFALAVMPFAVLSTQGLDVITLLAVVFCAVLFVVFQLALRRQWPKRALRELGAGPTTFRFDDFGVSASSSSSQHRLAWSVVSRYVETPDAFAIYTTPRRLLIVPKRAFSRAQAAQVSEVLKTRVSAKPGAAPPNAVLKRVLLAWLAVIVAFLACWFLLNDAPETDPTAPGPAADEPR